MPIPSSFALKEIVIEKETIGLSGENNPIEEALTGHYTTDT